VLLTLSATTYKPKSLKGRTTGILMIGKAIP